jgi:hypothetical protein
MDTLCRMNTLTRMAESVYLALPASPWITSFQERVLRRGADDCWPWAGVIHPTLGYATLTQTLGGLSITLYAHRVAWILAHGETIPDDRMVDRRTAICTDRACCNPRHMELVTVAENARRMNEIRWSGQEWSCRHGHVGERAFDHTNKPYCRACNREKAARVRARQRAARLKSSSR